MCASHHDASPTAAAGRPSSPISGRGPRREAGAAISNRESQASSVTVTVRTAPASSASRTRVPVTPITTLATPSTRTRSPTPTPRRRAPLTAARPRAPRSTHSAGRRPDRLSAAVATSGGTAPAAPAAVPGQLRPLEQAPPACEGLQPAPRRSRAPGTAGAGNATATARSPSAPDQDPRPASTPSQRPRTPNAVTANVSASRAGIRSSGRTSTTTPVPSSQRAKKSGACRRTRPRPSRQRSQNG